MEKENQNIFISSNIKDEHDIYETTNAIAANS